MTPNIEKVLVILPPFVNATLKPGEDGYKGTERSAVYMIRELQSRGITVHLIAPQGSDEPTLGKLWPSCPRPLWDFSDPANVREASVAETRQAQSEMIRLMEKVVKEEKPDIVDCHIPHHTAIDKALSALDVPHVVTFHGPLFRQGIKDAIKEHPALPVITVSELQRKPLEGEALKPNYAGVCPNGLPDEKEIQPTPKDEPPTLAMLGRISRKKAFERGVEIAKRANLKLVIAGIVLTDPDDKLYYKTVLAPIIEKEKDTVSLNTNIVETNKTWFLQSKLALLALTKRDNDEWGAPYIEADGIHITETLRAGTAVICDEGVDALKVPKSVGFRCQTDDEIVKILREGKIFGIKSEDCRRHFLENYAVNKTVDQRLRVWRDVIMAFEKSANGKPVSKTANGEPVNKAANGEPVNKAANGESANNADNGKMDGST